VPGQGVVVERVKKEASLKLAKIHKNSPENGQFRSLYGLKIAENPVFCSKVLNKIYSQDVF
jgi:hypothetical protein